MKLKDIIAGATNKANFVTLRDYIRFCETFLEYISKNLQATIISQNENHYQFYQYDKSGGFQITRPINSNLMYDSEGFSKIAKELPKILKAARELDKSKNKDERTMLNNGIYTIQQSIGAALDGLAVGKSNTARKLNGDLFENFIRLVIRETGVDCKAAVIQIPVLIEDEVAFKMSYQHDLVIETNDKIRLIGSIKTSSKDRIDKIFIDKFLYNKLAEKDIPHVAIFLNDVQRKNGKSENKYGINSTFLPGHFKGYTIKLNPLDGVYYCDIRPNMLTEAILKDYIKTFDCFLCEDLWQFL